MLVWCTLLFILGVSAFLDSLFSMGDIFRRVNSVLFMLVSLGLFFRTTSKMKLKNREEKEKQLVGLLQRVKSLESSREKLSEY